MWIFGAEFQAWQAQRAGPHHTHGQQFPFLLAFPGGPGLPLRSRFSWEHHAEGQGIPSKTLSRCPRAPGSRRTGRAGSSGSRFQASNCAPRNFQVWHCSSQKSPGGFAPGGKTWRSVRYRGWGLIPVMVSAGAAGINLSIGFGCSWARLSSHDLSAIPSHIPGVHKDAASLETRK